jgi:glycosyltransferase involved in cell wall biosynthesis
MKVSIIITCFNREKYLSRAIRSAISQRFPREDLEVIVVDDGSTDHSPEIAMDYGSEIVFIREEKNLGLPVARNLGIKRGKGRYVVNLDSDDYMHEDLIYVEHLHLSLNPHWAAVSCDYVLVDDNEMHISRISGTNKPIACGVMFRKDALITVGLYDEDMRVCEDHDLRLRFMQRYHIGHVELPLYRYRKHMDNITNDDSLVTYYNGKIVSKYMKEGKHGAGGSL